jgi:hypothetical protein
MANMTSETVSNLLDRVLSPVGHCLTPEAARKLIDLRADPAVQQRVDELADRNTEGLLTPEEREEYEAYVTAANIIAILQGKARAVLRGDAA